MSRARVGIVIKLQKQSTFYAHLITKRRIGMTRRTVSARQATSIHIAKVLTTCG